MLRSRLKKFFSALVLLTLSVASAQAQITTASIAGVVTGPNGAPYGSARVTATHVPSGTSYTAQTNASGRYIIAAARVGGPYTVVVRGLGFQPKTQEDIFLDLGVRTDLNFALTTAVTRLQSVTVTSDAGTFSSTRTGAATKVSSEAIAAFPTIGRTLTDFTRLAPQANGASFAGMDTRYNNITIDGSYFNNSFGLAGQPGGRTNVSPIPIDAVEQLQVNIAPYDVRQGNFVGAGVNAVTKSGTNVFKGSAYYVKRDQGLVGKTLRGVPFNPGTFDFSLFGGSLGGPIIKNKLFFYASYESDKNSLPGTTFLPNTGTQTVGGNVTRVLDSDLSTLSTYLQSKFNYSTGPYTAYNNETPSKRFIAKIDWNINDKHKFSLRYNTLNSQADQLISNSSSLGFGNRRTLTTAMSYQSSGYIVLENIKSAVAELTSQLSNNMSNDLVVGYTKNDESRAYKGAFFPTVDILSQGSTYISFGMDPFTPSNQLRYNTFQVQNNLSYYTKNQDFTFGLAYEKYHSDNVFYQGANSVYVFNSLNDFYTDANDFLANPTRTVSPIKVNKFQVQYVNIPGMTEPLQPLDVRYVSAFVQDEWRATPRLKITAGLRMDRPTFGATGFDNPQANAYTYRDENGAAAKYSTSKLPDAKPLWSPRVGFNWDVAGDKSTQIRGGTGVFTGKPAYVWISNQIGNNGVITGAIEQTNSSAYPFNPNADAYKPKTVTGAPAASYTLNFTDPNFKFPQLWRSNLAIDHRLPDNWVATLEALYSRDVNGMYYINANLTAPAGNYTGADTRPRWISASGGNRVNANVNGAYVLKNEQSGYSYTYSASLEKAFQNGFFAKLAYNYGMSQNTHDPGSIASGNWTGNAISRNPNNAANSYSQFSPGHRYFLALSYKQMFTRLGATTFSFFGEGNTQGNDSYIFSGDANGDGATGNDLLYIPKSPSEMNFKQFTSSGTTFTVPQQTAAWEAYIQQDPYLRQHRGEYARRGAVFLPMLFRADVAIAQEITRTISGKGNSLELRLDILNVTNLINNRWGISSRLVSNSPLTSPSIDANGALTYQMRNFQTSLMSTTFQQNAGLNDAYRMQISVRYKFF